MTAFAPVDVRTPDARRKQLVQKLMQQQMSQRPNAAWSSGMHPGAAWSSGVNPGAAWSSAIGQSDRSFHALGRPGHGAVSVTQNSNVLPSILANLGIGGRARPDEMSPGLGQPIAPPHATPQQPGPGWSPAGQPIQAPGSGIPAPAVGSPAAAPGGVPGAPAVVQLGGGLVYDPAVDQVRMLNHYDTLGQAAGNLGTPSHFGLSQGLNGR